MIRLFFTLFCVALIYGVTLLREKNETKQNKSNHYESSN